MVAKIYRPTRTAMQSGTAKTKDWVLEHEAESARSVEPLMGWTSSSDMAQQVKLRFESKEAAIAYAERKGLPYVVQEAQEAKRRPMSYSDNFAYTRVGSWTH